MCLNQAETQPQKSSGCDLSYWPLWHLIKFRARGQITSLLAVNQNFKIGFQKNAFIYLKVMFVLCLPSCHFHTVTVCSWSRPTDSRSFPVALKLTEQTPPEWKQRSTDRVCFVMASHTWMDGDVAERGRKGKAAALHFTIISLHAQCFLRLQAFTYNSMLRLLSGLLVNQLSKVAARWQ